MAGIMRAVVQPPIERNRHVLDFSNCSWCCPDFHHTGCVFRVAKGLCHRVEGGNVGDIRANACLHLEAFPSKIKDRAKYWWLICQRAANLHILAPPLEKRAG